MEHKLFEVYEEGGQYFFEIPGNVAEGGQTLGENIRLGPYKDKDKAEWDSSQAEATF